MHFSYSFEYLFLYSSRNSRALCRQNQNHLGFFKNFNFLISVIKIFFYFSIKILTFGYRYRVPDDVILLPCVPLIDLPENEAAYLRSLDALVPFGF